MKGKKCQVKISGGGKTRTVDIEKFPFIIGRGDKSDLKINSSGVSRSHLSVNFTEDSLSIEDLSSSNGTLLNGKKLSPLQPVRYKANDIIKLGLAEDVLTLAVVADDVRATAPAKPPVDSAVVRLPPLPQTKIQDKALPQNSEPSYGHLAHKSL